jgi:hypothetical protein
MCYYFYEEWDGCTNKTDQSCKKRFDVVRCLSFKLFANQEEGDSGICPWVVEWTVMKPYAGNCPRHEVPSEQLGPDQKEKNLRIKANNLRFDEPAARYIMDERRKVDEEHTAATRLIGTPQQIIEPARGFQKTIERSTFGQERPANINAFWESIGYGD